MLLGEDGQGDGHDDRDLPSWDERMLGVPPGRATKRQIS